MLKNMSLALLASASFLAGINQAAAIEAGLPTEPTADLRRAARAAAVAPVRMASAERSNMGGGFIEFLFRTDRRRAAAISSSRLSAVLRTPAHAVAADGRGAGDAPAGRCQRARASRVRSEIREAGGRLSRQGKRRHDRHRHAATSFLFLVQGDGTAMRYGIGVGQPGFTWAGVKTGLREEGMAGLDAAAGDAAAPPGSAALHGRRPGESARRARDVSRLVALPHPRLERALDHRHQAVSSGCIRMRNEDVIDLYEPRQGRHQGRGDLTPSLDVKRKGRRRSAAFLLCVSDGTSLRRCRCRRRRRSRPSSMSPSSKSSSSASFDASSNSPARSSRSVVIAGRASGRSRCR